MTDNDEMLGRGDLLHTAVALFAAAGARDPEIVKGAHDSSLERRFEFFAMAAATEADADLPASAISAQDGSIVASVETKDDEIWVSLQLKGFAALAENAGQNARLVSHNRAIDYGFRFGANGSAVCVLANERPVRQGLSEFVILCKARADSA